MTFWKWLQQAQANENFAGDFIRDAKDDDRLKARKPLSWDELEGYLLCRGACSEALEGARQAWRRYQEWRKRHGLPKLREPIHSWDRLTG